MTRAWPDILAVAVIVAAAAVVCAPLLARLEGVPPDDDDLDLDGLSYYGYAGAARQTVTRFHQFPLRSPWHGGGYPLYAYPDDLTLTPTMLLVLAAGPWAAIKIDFLLTMIAGGLGMYLLTRRKMGYPPVAALFSATAFALGGFLLARWLRGWRVPTHAVWLPLLMYALWAGRRRRCWLAVAALLVAWLIIDHKYVALMMGWFLVLVGLLRLDDEDAGAGTWDPGPGTRNPLLPSPDFAWGYFGRLLVVWVAGAGLAAVKLVPMLPLLTAHVRAERLDQPPRDPVKAVLLWMAIFAALGVTPLVGRFLRARRTRAMGALAAALVVALVVGAVLLLAPPSRPADQLRIQPATRLGWIAHVAECLVSAGTWRQNEAGVWSPTAPPENFRHRAPVGPLVLMMAAAAVALRWSRMWRWAILAALFLALELGPATSRELAESLRGLPLLSWIRRPREQLNFYLFFILCLLAGRALPVTPHRRLTSTGPAERTPVEDNRWHSKEEGTRPDKVFTDRASRDTPAARKRYRTHWGMIVSCVAVAANVLYLGWQAYPRYAYTVSASPPEARPWGPYELLDHRSDQGRAIDRWRDQPCFLLRGNIGLQYWDLDFRDDRRDALVPSLKAEPRGAYRRNPAYDARFTDMVAMDRPGNEAKLKTFTPNEIVVEVAVRSPGILVVNQIGDDDWRPSEGRLVPGSLVLAVELTRVGEYEVRLRYVPVLLRVGALMSAVAVVGGCLFLVLASRGGRP